MGAVAVAAVVGLLVYSLRMLVPKAKMVDSMRTMPTPAILKNHCEEHIGPPRVIRVRTREGVLVEFFGICPGARDEMKAHTD